MEDGRSQLHKLDIPRSTDVVAVDVAECCVENFLHQRMAITEVPVQGRRTNSDHFGYSFQCESVCALFIKDRKTDLDRSFPNVRSSRGPAWLACILH